MVFVVPNVGIGKNKNIHSARDLFDAIRSHIPKKKKTFSFSFLFFSMENIVKVREEHLLRCENFNHHSYIFIEFMFLQTWVYQFSQLNNPTLSLVLNGKAIDYTRPVASVSKYCHYYHLLLVTCVGYLMLTYTSCYSKISPFYE